MVAVGGGMSHPGGAEALHQHVPPPAIERTVLLDARLRAVERGHGRDLHRRERAVVEIGLHPRQRLDQLAVADGEPDPPARHGIGLAERGEFDRDIDRAGDLKDRGRWVVVEIDLGIGQVRDHVDPARSTEIDDLLVEPEVHGVRGRIGGKVQDHGQRRGDAVARRALDFRQEINARTHRNVTQRAARDDESVGVDRIGRVGDDHHVARAGDRHREVGEPLLGTERGDGLALGIDRHPEAPLVIARDRAPQPANAARVRIAVRLRILHRLDELRDDMGRRGGVRIAHAEIDDVLAGRARRRLHRVHLGEDVGRKALDPVELLLVLGRSAHGTVGFPLLSGPIPPGAGSLSAAKLHGLARGDKAGAASRIVLRPPSGVSRPSRPRGGRVPRSGAGSLRSNDGRFCGPGRAPRPSLREFRPSSASRRADAAVSGWPEAGFAPAEPRAWLSDPENQFVTPHAPSSDASATSPAAVWSFVLNRLFHRNGT